MVSPEQPNISALREEFKRVVDKLEQTDENENTIERFNKRGELLELHDTLQDEIASSETK